MGVDQPSGASRSDVHRIVRHFRRSLLGSKPDELQTQTGGTNGGTASFDEFGGLVESAAAGDDFASILGFSFGQVSALEGVIIVSVKGYHDAAIGGAGDYPVIGYFDHTNPDPAANNIAVFNPGAGDNAAGNVRVDNAGADTDGSIAYPTLSVLNYYEVAIDTVAGETRFYINDSDLGQGAPVATVGAVPVQAGRALGYGIIGGNASAFRATRFSQIERNDVPQR